MIRKPLFSIALLLLVLAPAALRAQNTIFLSQGVIEFERKENLYSKMDDEDESWNDLMKKAVSKFKLTYFNLSFNGNTTLYQPGRENPDNNGRMMMMSGPADANVVYNNLDSGMSTSQKNVFDQLYLVTDSTRKIKWKITDENRVIAGFACRRANAVIMDSIYVVAFYTDEIIAPGGPESFTGLPGMILGVSLPHQHVSWFATRVTAKPVGAGELKVPTKGKKTDNASMLGVLKDRMKEWGKFGQRNMEAVTL